MIGGKTVALLIPARNEEESLPLVLGSCPGVVDYVVVVDNGSADRTAEVALQAGAEVVREPRPGYGRACLAGLGFLAAHPPDIVAFADGDGSDALSFLEDIVLPLAQDEADLSLGRRVPSDPRALSIQQRFGNRLATTLIRLIWNHSFGDLGPMRAVTWHFLDRLDMRDKGFGWTVEMQVRAVKAGGRIHEVPVPYHRRSAGRSKVSRTLSGTVKAGAKILWVIGREAADAATMPWRQGPRGEARR